jgi:hypothetical protein
LSTVNNLGLEAPPEFEPGWRCCRFGAVPYPVGWPRPLVPGALIGFP